MIRRTFRFPSFVNVTDPAEIILIGPSPPGTSDTPYRGTSVQVRRISVYNPDTDDDVTFAVNHIFYPPDSNDEWSVTIFREEVSSQSTWSFGDAGGMLTVHANLEDGTKRDRLELVPTADLDVALQVMVTVGLEV